MPLLSIFASDPSAIAEFSIEQIVSAAGDGALKDKSECSSELREYLLQINTSKIETYINQCLASSFVKGGMVLQDLINEIGRRLDYDVVNGRYQGVTGEVGFDGLWNSPERQSLIIEVKTTDAYRLSLDTLAGYRRRLIERGEATQSSSILIIVGRQDTGELEAQIRGSRHAWDVRVISAEALIKLAVLKEGSEESETGLKIRSLLTPMEYTRLDRMVDVMFTTVVDLERAPDTEASPDAPARSPEKGASASMLAANPGGFTSAQELQEKREAIIGALAERERTPLIRKSRALYRSGDGALRVACAMSKLYESTSGYWYAFHPEWDDFLGTGERAFFVLGCMDREEAFAVPHHVLKPILPSLHTTTKSGRTYWHIRLSARHDDLELIVPKSENLSLRPYRLGLS